MAVRKPAVRKPAVRTFNHTGPKGDYAIRVGGRIARVSGIDRYPDSPHYGRQVLETIHLWRNPYSGAAERSNLKGALRHGDEVQLVRQLVHNKQRWHYVKATVVFDGKSYPQSGWVKNQLIEQIEQLQEVVT